MSWIKRNLYFLIGSVVALALLGMAGFYLYSKWDLNNKALDQLNQSYEDLKKLNAQNPHPGSGNVNNIEEARQQIKELTAALEKTRKYFQKVPRIPDLPKISDFEFSSALARTIAQLSHEATNNSVAIPSGYSFSFQAQRNKMGFAAGSLAPLSAQLGEVKAICDVLFAAKVNALDYIRRERVSPDDNVNQSDYVAEKSITNALAVLSPYEVSFNCFSPELAAVLSGLASSPHGLIAQFVNVEMAPASAVDVTTPVTPVYTAPAYVAQPVPIQPARSPEQQMRDRYGIGGGGRPGEGADARMRERYGIGGSGKFPSPTPPPVQPQPGVPAAPVKAGLPTVIDEKKLKVTMLIDVVKLLPPAPSR